MKLRNKKSGEIVETQEIYESLIGEIRIRKKDKKIDSYDYRYSSLKELNEEWEDYEEPKEYWYYDTTKNGTERITHLEDKEKDQEIGNYFETKEEAEKVVEKLKAWKRLKDKGFRFTFWDIRSGSGEDGHCEGEFVMFSECPNDIEKADLDLLFGGEDD